MTRVVAATSTSTTRPTRRRGIVRSPLAPGTYSPGTYGFTCSAVVFEVVTVQLSTRVFYFALYYESDQRPFTYSRVLFLSL